MRRALAIGLVLTALVACQADLQHGLTETEANEILVLLAANGVAGTKTGDGPTGDWAVRVPAADATRSWQLLQAAGLPRRHVEGFAETFGDGGLIPSPTDEHVRYLRALSGELERSLMSMPGVVDARVHLVAPMASRWPGQEAAGDPPRASVLVVYRPGPGGVDGEAVRRLVSGAVVDLVPERVEVVATPHAVGSGPVAEAVSQVGPFSVSQGSRGPLQLALALAGALVLGLSVALALVLVRGRRARSAVP